jgi:hypothetical protein
MPPMLALTLDVDDRLGESVVKHKVDWDEGTLSLWYQRDYKRVKAIIPLPKEWVEQIKRKCSDLPGGSIATKGSWEPVHPVLGCRLPKGVHVHAVDALNYEVRINEWPHALVLSATITCP